MVAACAAPPRATPTKPHALLREMAAVPPAPPPRPAAPAPAAATPVAQAPREEPPRCNKLGWVDMCEPPAPHADAARLASDEVQAWFTRRGAKPPKDFAEIDCDLVRIGPDREEALACVRVRHYSQASAANVGGVYRVGSDWFVIAVRAKRAQTLVSVSYVVDVLDREGLDGPLFAMGVVLDAGGQRIAVMEPGENACAQAKTNLAKRRKELSANADADERRAMTDWVRFDAKLLDDICRQPRVWIYRQSRFHPLAASGGVVSSARF